jgi:hypothetical protein
MRASRRGLHLNHCVDGVALCRINEISIGARLERISPSTIIAAAIMTQIAVLLIVLHGSIYRLRNEIEYSWQRQSSPNGPIYGFLAGITIFSLLILGLSDAFVALWLPIIKDAQFVGIPLGYAILSVWILDILFLGYLVIYTGGSRSSPFTSLFFVFPTIALFLHESGIRLVLYTTLVIILFTVSLVNSREENPISKLSLWIVSVESFILTTAIGFFTRQ